MKFEIELQIVFHDNAHKLVANILNVENEKRFQTALQGDPFDGVHDMIRADNFIRQLGRVMLEGFEPSLSMAFKFTDTEFGRVAEVDQELHNARKLEWSEKFKKLTEPKSTKP